MEGYSDYIDQENIGDSPIIDIYSSKLSVLNQWILSIIIILGIIIWIVNGGVTNNSMLNEYIIPISIGVLSYFAAYGYFKMPTLDFIKNIIPLFVTIILVGVFMYNGALLPFLIGSSSVSFMFILVLVNSARNAQGDNGLPVLTMSYDNYVIYIAYLLSLANGFINGIFYILAKKYKWKSNNRWLLSFLSPLIILFIPAMINILSGNKNGQYNVDNMTFIRLYLSIAWVFTFLYIYSYIIK